MPLGTVTRRPVTVRVVGVGIVVVVDGVVVVGAVGLELSPQPTAMIAKARIFWNLATLITAFTDDDGRWEDLVDFAVFLGSDNEYYVNLQNSARSAKPKTARPERMEGQDPE